MTLKTITLETHDHILWIGLNRPDQVNAFDLQLYKNLGDTDLDLLPNFMDVAGSLGVGDAAKPSIGAVFVDYDNDGDQDLYVTHYGSNTLEPIRKL